MKIAILCAKGIGDALILHSLNLALTKKGWDVTTISPHLQGFGNWLRGISAKDLQGDFDAYFLQHTNSSQSFEMQEKSYVFYGTHNPLKHAPFREDKDYVCNRTKTMVENVDAAALKFFGVSTKGYAMLPPKNLIHRRNKRRVAIHPTSSNHEKIWPKDKFIQVYQKLQQMGYDPVFTVSSQEAKEWDSPKFLTLGDLAAFLYESGAFIGNDSGLGHLASLLQIPHLIIAGDGLQMPLWKTGWYPGINLAPPSWLMNFKAFRKRWKLFISPNNVIKNLNKSILY